MKECWLKTTLLKDENSKEHRSDVPIGLIAEHKQNLGKLISFIISMKGGSKMSTGLSSSDRKEKNTVKTYSHGREKKFYMGLWNVSDAKIKKELKLNH